MRRLLVHRFPVLDFLWNSVENSNFHEVTSGPRENWAVLWIGANISPMASHQCLFLIFEEFGLWPTLMGLDQTHMSSQNLPFLLFSDPTRDYSLGLKQ